MRKSVSRGLFLIGLLFAIVAAVLFVLGIQGSSFTSLQNSSDFSTVMSNIGNPGLVFTAFGLWAIASILIFIAWIGALVKTAQLGRWGWFVFLLILSHLTMLIYIFAGPTAPANQPAYAAPYPPQYPPQYPRQ